MTAYEMRISDWSSDVCSSDLVSLQRHEGSAERPHPILERATARTQSPPAQVYAQQVHAGHSTNTDGGTAARAHPSFSEPSLQRFGYRRAPAPGPFGHCRSRRGPASERIGIRRYGGLRRSEENTSALQSLMRITYDVFCLKKTKDRTQHNKHK